MSGAMHPLGVGAAGPAPAPPQAKGARRPGLVTFAAYMLFLVGGFSLVWAGVAFAQPAWLHDAYSARGYLGLTGSAWAWGLLDLLVGAIALAAGVGVLRGGPFAQVIGLAVVGFSAVRWFFFLPVAPWVALTVLALDVLVVYGLVAHSAYFDVDTAHQQ